MNKEELFKLTEIIEKEKELCNGNCCKNHLTIIEGYLLKMVIDTKSEGEK